MVLEYLFTPKEVERRPLDMMILGFGSVSISLWLAYYIFPRGTSSWLLFLTTLVVVPLIERVLMTEETKEMQLGMRNILKRHYHIIWVYIFLFVGMLLAVIFWKIAISADLVSIVFSNQLRWASINILPTDILLTNIKILLVFTLFALIFGSGAILLLAWNASFTGILVANLIVSITTFRGVMGALLPLTYGILDMLGYSLATIAGGILSVSVMKGHWKTPQFIHIIVDFLFLMMLSITLISLSAITQSIILY